jgi:hypothetical protein
MDEQEQKNTLFLITRYINSESNSQIWKHCVKSIQTYYPLSVIILIDNGSDKKYLHSENQ